MIQQNSIDSTTQRDVGSFVISGTIFSATFAGSMNFKKYRKYEISKAEAVQDTLKLAVQGGIGTGCAVSAANSFGRGNYINGLFSIALGAVGVYGAEKISETIEKKYSKKEPTALENWIKNDRDDAIKNSKVKTDG